MPSSVDLPQLTSPDSLLQLLQNVPLISSVWKHGFVRSADLLSGGLVNFVYRLHIDVEPNATTVTTILKYYPPYLKSSASVSFSQERYFVEKDALFAAQSVHQEAGLPVRVPKVLAHDDDLKCLVIEDAGQDIISLMDFFMVPSGTPPAVPATSLTPEAIAHSLGHFLASLYRLDTSKLPPTFHNPTAWEMVNRHIVGGFKPKLETLGALEDLACWVQRAGPVGPPPDAVLIMGDLWPNSVYINPKDESIWLLDWEVARFGSCLSDTRQMLCNLYMMEKTPGRFRCQDVARFRSELVNVVKGGTGKEFGEQEQTDFMVLLACIVDNEFWRCEDPAGMLRAAAAECTTYLHS